MLGEAKAVHPRQPSGLDLGLRMLLWPRHGCPSCSLNRHLEDPGWLMKKERFRKSFREGGGVNGIKTLYLSVLIVHGCQESSTQKKKRKEKESVHQ